MSAFDLVISSLSQIQQVLSTCDEGLPCDVIGQCSVPMPESFIAWMHSCQTKTWFKSPWVASQNAAFLAFDLGHVEWSAPRFCDISPLPRPGIRTVSKRGPIPRLKFPNLVTFDDVVEVAFADESDGSFSSVTLPHVSLQEWIEKPWSLYPGTSSSVSFPHMMPRHLPVAAVPVEGGVVEIQPNIGAADVRQVAENRGDPLSSVAVSISGSRGLVQVSQGCLPVKSNESCLPQPAHAVSVTGSELSPASQPVGESHFGVVESFPVFCPIALVEPHVDVCDVSAQPLPFNVHLKQVVGVQCPANTDSSSGRVPEANPSDPSDLGRSMQHPPPLPEIPQFARDIVNLPIRGAPVPASSIARGVWIRVWYIHLQIHARSFLVRHRVLQGPPHLWQQQIEDLWSDVLLPDEDRQVSLVTPAPPRNQFELELVHDLILSQGVGGRFLPGLVTMRPVDTGIDRAIYSGAVALPPAVNRQTVVDSLALTRLCQDRICTVRQRRTVMADAQYLQMHAGFSFLVEVGHLRSRAAGSEPISVPDRTRISRHGSMSSGPDHSFRLELLTQLRAAGHLSGSVAHVDEVDAVDQSNPEDAILHHSSLALESVHPVSSSCPETSVAQCVQGVRSSQSFVDGPFVSGFDFPQVPVACCDPLSIDDKILGCLDFFTVPVPTFSELDYLLPDVCPVHCKLADDQGPRDRPPTESERALRPVPAQAPPVPPPIVPQFARAMMQDLPEEFLTGAMTLRGFMVRTWYIHHRHALCNRVPRFLQITGPPHTWGAQVSALWFDRLVPFEHLSIHVVQPQPYRDRHERIIAFDLIVSHGLYVERRSGLVTVHPPVEDPSVPRTVLAASFAVRVAGQDLVDSVDFQDTCQRYRCMIFFRWQEIPLTAEPFHDMHAGDGFALHVHGPPRSPSDHPAASAPADPHVHDDDVDMEESSSTAGSSHVVAAHVGPAPAPAAVNHHTRSPTQRVLLYRLGHPATAAFVRWSDFHSLCIDVAQALAVAPIDVVTLHFLQSRPVGQQPNEEAIIVHMRNDIDFASDEQLVLVDVVLHQHRVGHLSLGSPWFDRRVFKIQRPVTRQHMLEYARVDSYCEFVQNRCLVKLNQALWPAQELALRNVLHGAYVQVFLPPPASTELPPLRTIQLVEDTANILFEGDFASFYPHWFSHSLAGNDVSHDSTPTSSCPAGSSSASGQQKGSRFCDSYVDFVPLVEHLNDEDQGSPPSFTRDLHTVVQPLALNALQLPPIQNFPQFALEFGVTFRDRADVDYEDQGPVLHVLTWYIHHGVFLRCTRPVIVQLEADPTTWPDALTAPWRDQIQPGVPLAFREVMPNPPGLFRDHHKAHIILEQGLDFPRYATLVSILSQGMYHDATVQVALSMPHAISAEDVIRAVHLEDRCLVYRCTVWSGIMQFDPTVREEVFSGIGIYLHIHAARFRHLLLDFGSQPFWHLDSSSSASSSQQAVWDRRAPSVLPPGYERSIQALDAAATHDAHLSGLFVPDLQVAWQQYLACTPSGPYRFHVIVWFCDHVRLPRSSEGRLAELQLDSTTWKATLCHTWHDWVLPGLEVSYYVVRPMPLGATGVVAHIIIAQNEAPAHASVLISSTLPGENPWDPVHRVVRLPVLVDHHMLIHEGGLMNMCPPLRFGLRCQSWIDAQELSDGHLYLASSGDGFLIAASELPREDLHVIPSTDLTINGLFATVLGLLTDVSCQVAAAVDQSLPLDFLALTHRVPISLFDCLSAPAVASCPAAPDEPSPSFALSAISSVQRSVPGVPAGNPASTVVLSLDACLDLQPKISLERSTAPEILCRQLEDWPQQLAKTSFRLAELPAGLDLSASTLWAFQDPSSALEPAFADSSVFYVDGSAGNGRAAWSVLLIRYDSQGCPTFHGCCADLVHVATQHAHFLGAQSPDNISAELTAVVVAMLASLCLEDLGQVIVRPDLKLSAMLANDVWTCKAHPALAALCQLLGSWFSKVSGKLIEVRGHTRHPWNDLADALANHAVKCQGPIGEVSLDVCHGLVTTGDLDWAWLVGELPSLKACFPPETEIASWKIVPSWRKVSTAARSPSVPKMCPVQFTLCSANVLALGTVDSVVPTATCSERALRLDDQWHKGGVSVVGLQESRREQGCVDLPHFFGFASGFQQTARATHFGCELWLHKTRPLDPDGTLTWKDFKCTVVHADPRRLFVNLHHPTTAISFVVLHAPCKTATTSIQDVSDWWQQTCALAHTACLASLSWIFVDANAPLASEHTALFSMHGAESSNPQGEIFESALHQMLWYVPSTMSHLHQGPPHSWTHPRGSQVRRDYVLCSRTAFELTDSSWTDIHFDGGFAHEDHLPVMLRCAGFLSVGAGCPKIQWDALALLDPDRCAAFQQALTSLPVPTWQTHVDSHAQMLETQLLSLARQFFEKRTFEKTRPRLSEATQSLIALKRSCLDYGRANDLMSDSSFRQELRSLEAAVRHRVKADQRCFYAALVDQLAEAGQLHDSRQVFRLLSRLGGRKTKSQAVRALPMLKVNDVPVKSFVEQQRVWLRQFADIKAGHVIAKEAFSTFVPANLGIPEDAFDFQALPTCTQIRDQLHRLKRSKAPGPDELPTDVLKAGASAIAKHLTVLTTKIAAHGKEPECWRGGRLVPLHKGKLKRTDPAGYRAIFLNNFTTKTYHAVLRGHLVQAWDAVLANMQYGGRKGYGCDLAHHVVQAQLAFCCQQRLPSAILFVDFRSAFYSVVRQGLFQQPMDDTAFLTAMHRLGVHPDHINTLLTQSAHDVAIAQISSHSITLLRDVLSATYFQMEGLSEIAVTTRGTRPGDPIGDVAFNLTMSLIMKDVTEYMAASEATWEGSPSPLQDFHSFQHPAMTAWSEIAYVDDLAMTLRAPSNDQVLQMTCQATNAIMQASCCRGLDPTFGAGKTELLFSPKGIGTTQTKQHLAAQGQCVEVASVADEQVWKVPVVLTYKHLGTWVNNDAKAKHAVRASLCTARKAWGPLVRPFLAKKHISLTTKMQVFESVVLSRLLFNAHVWSMVTDGELAQWEAGFRPMLYALAKPRLRGHAPFLFSIRTLCGMCGIMTPTDLLHVARLRYLKRILPQCPAVLWHAVRSIDDKEGTWLWNLRKSLQWLVQFSHASFALSVQAPWEDWFSFIALDSRWKGRLKRASHSCREYRRAYAEDQVWHYWLQHALSDDGVVLSLDESPVVPSSAWSCDLCSARFASKRALAVHAMQLHGYKTVFKHYSHDGQCSHCAKDFHSRIRLCAHFRNSPACFQRIQAIFPALTVACMEELDVHDRELAQRLKQQGWLPTKAELPVVRAFGPGLPLVDSADALMMRQRWTARSSNNEAPAHEGLLGHCNQIGGLPPKPLFPILPDPAGNDIRFVYQSGSGANHGECGRFSLRGLATLYARLHIKTICFIHFYSGYRRVGDLQHSLDNHWIQGIWQVFCISVDYCIQGDVSNLATGKSREFWVKQIQSGAIAGLGSTLMRFLLECLYWCARCGAAGFLEHPGFPVWARHFRPPSIWCSLAVRWLRRLACTSIVTFDQCVFHCAARKPTTLLLIRLPSLRDYILSLGDGGRCAHPPHSHPPLQGRHSDGTFRTAIAKVYPERMNQAICDAFASFVQCTFLVDHPAAPLPADLSGLGSLDFVSCDQACAAKQGTKVFPGQTLIDVVLKDFRKSMENSPCVDILLFKTLIFHSYVKLPEGAHNNLEVMMELVLSRSCKVEVTGEQERPSRCECIANATLCRE
eukprot:s605_g9.t1